MRAVNPRTHLYYEPKTRRWSAYVREPWVGGKRLYLGTHQTQKLANRCQDRAKLKLEAELTQMSSVELACKQLKPIHLIFPREDYEQDKHGTRDSLNREQFFAYLVHESRGAYQQYEPSPCLVKFLAEEPTMSNMGSSSSPLQLNEDKKQPQTSVSTTSGELRNMASVHAPARYFGPPKEAPSRGPCFIWGTKRQRTSRQALGKSGAAQALLSMMQSNAGVLREESHQLRMSNQALGSEPKPSEFQSVLHEDNKLAR